MAFFDEKFNTVEFLYGLNPNDFLFEKSLILSPASNILSLGEGEGRNALFLLKQGHHVTAVDESIVGLNKSKDLCKDFKNQFKTIHTDIAQFDFQSNYYSGIVSIWFHLPTSLRKVIHRKCVESLKPGGFFILEAYTPKQLNNNSGGPKNIDMLMNLEDLKSELEGLKLLEAREIDRNINEGTGHVGMSAVVQILGQKL